MAERPEVRILLYPQKDGKVEISLLDPRTNRESKTGLKVMPDRVDEHVRRLKEALERSGSWVSAVKWMS